MGVPDTSSARSATAGIRGDDGTVGVEAADRLRRCIASAKAALPAVGNAVGDQIAVYVRTVLALLAQAGLPLSPRRAGMLHRTILAVHAVSATLLSLLKTSYRAEFLVFLPNAG